MEENPDISIRCLGGDLEDRELVALVLAGDEKAQALFYKKYQSRLRSTCIHFLGYLDPECEDLVQETYVLAFKNFSQFDYRKDLYSWLNKICVNLCFQRLKSRQRLVVTQAEELELAAQSQVHLQQDAEQGVLKQEAFDLVRKALRRLGDKCREIIQLRDLDGKSYIEIATALKLAPGTVFSRLARCRAALKQLVMDAGGGAHG
jgi:RNA polymerase sigma-70 factor (ECF subfamily)